MISSVVFFVTTSSEDFRYTLLVPNTYIKALVQCDLKVKSLLLTINQYKLQWLNPGKRIVKKKKKKRN